MQYIAITGISSQVLRELQEERLRTIEIRSPHNFLSAQAAGVGDKVFLTRSSFNDIKAGTIGLIASIRRIQISMHRILHRTDDVFEECEMSVARLQLELEGIGRVRRVEEVSLGKPLVLEADRVTYLEAK